MRSNLTQKLIFISLFLWLPTLLHAQTFPVALISNPGHTYVNSTTVDDDGFIYITGRTSSFLQFQNCTSTPFLMEASTTNRIFAAKLNPAGTSVIWFVTSGPQPVGEIYAGNDIEVDDDEKAYIVGTMSGSTDIELTSWPFTSISTCGSGTRHFVLCISQDGEPEWVAETEASANSYGQGITLDLPNNRLHTGGYVSPITGPTPISFPDENCTPGCDFTAIPEVSLEVGFLTSYTLTGENVGAYQFGERVMALDMDRYESANVWVTGSRYPFGAPDRNVLFGKLQMNPTPCGPIVVDLDLPISDLGTATGGDIGWDIATAWNNTVMIVGTFTNTCNFPTWGALTAGAGQSDHFVASWNRVFSSFQNVITTTSLTPVTVNSDNYMQRHICIDVPSPENLQLRAIIGYDKDVVTDGTSDVDGLIISRELTGVSLNPLGVVSFPVSVTYGGPYGLAQQARAMETTYSPNTQRRYLAGDYSAIVSIGTCSLTGFGNDKYGYIARVNAAHSSFFKSEELALDKKINDEVVLFPNPSTGRVSLNLPSGMEHAIIQVYSTQGAMINSQEATSFSGQLDFTGFAPGIYFIKLDGNGVQKSYKLMLE